MLWCWLGFHDWFTDKSKTGKYTQNGIEDEGIFILQGCLQCTRERAYFERADGKKQKLSVDWLKKRFSERGW